MLGWDKKLPSANFKTVWQSPEQKKIVPGSKNCGYYGLSILLPHLLVFINNRGICKNLQLALYSKKKGSGCLIIRSSGGLK
jgi:hypothetical protein